MFKRAWHAAHGVRTCCAMAPKHYACLIWRLLAVQVSMEVKSGHADEWGVSAFVPI
jgi:hypothetical protein